MTNLKDPADLLGRILLAFIFVYSGFGKIAGYEGTAAYMDSQGVPGMLLPLVIVTELIGGLAIAIGIQTRLAAVVLAGFTLLSGLLFHFQPGDQMQMISFMKNVAIAGGFLVVAAHGPGAWSYDGRRRLALA